MSGFEIAGIILGAYPLIVTALETYKATRGGKGATKLARILKTEKIIFLEFIDSLVAPHVSENDLSRLKDPASPDLDLWSNESVQLGMTTRIGRDKADNVVEILKEIQTLLESIQQELAPLDYGIEILRRFRAGVRQVRINLPQSSLKDKLEDLTMYNVRLQRLVTDRSLPGDWANRARPKPSHRYLYRDSSHIVDFYNAVCDGYRCNCVAPHLANFSLPRISVKTEPDRPSINEWQYEVLFAMDESITEEVANTSSLELDREPRNWSYEVATQQQAVNNTRRISVSECEQNQGPEQSQLILDLCIFINTLHSDDAIPTSHAGLLRLKEKQYQLHVPITSRDGPVQQIECLDQFVEDQDFLLSRKDRIGLALSLSHAVLSLYCTPWIEACWTWKDFCIDRKNQGQLFATRRFYSSNKGDIISTSCDSLISEFWDIHGEPILTRLGFALIELALGKRLAELRSDMRFRSSDPDMLDFLTAKHIVESGRIMRAESQAYEDVVKVCLKHQFIRCSEPIGLDSSRSNFQEHAEQAILAPLHNIVTVSWGIGDTA